MTFSQRFKENKHSILAVLMSVYSLNELLFMIVWFSDNNESNSSQQKTNKFVCFVLQIAIIILTITAYFLVNYKKQENTYNVLNMIISILLNEYSVLSDCFSQASLCIALTLMIFFYPKLFNKNGEFYIKFFIPHSIYILLRYMFQAEINNVRSDIAIITSVFTLFTIILSYEKDENLNNQGYIQENGNSPIHLNKESDILNGQKTRDQFTLVKKDSKIYNETQCLKQQHCESNQFNCKSTQESFKKQSSFQFDFQELQKTGILIVNDKKEVVKVNSQFLYFLEENRNQLIQKESTQVDKRSQRDEFLLLSLKFDQQKQSFTQQQNNYLNEQLNSLQNNALYSDVNVDKDFFSIPHDATKQNQSEIKQNINLNDTIAKFKEEEQCQQCIDKNILMPSKICAHELDDTFMKTNRAHNISNNFQIYHLNNSLISNSHLYDIENQQNLQTMQRTPVNYQININNYKINNIQKNNNFSHAVMSSQQSSSCGLSKLRQCIIPDNIEELFEGLQSDICLGQVIDFLIKQQPQEILDSKVNQIFNCRQCQKLIKNQNSSVKYKKYSNTQFYKFRIESNFLIVSQIQKDKSNKKKIVEYKIGCYFNDQEGSYDLCQKCKICNQDYSSSVHFVNKNMSFVCPDNKTLNLIKEESLPSNKKVESLKQIANASNSKLDNSIKQYNQKTRYNQSAKACSLMSVSDNDHLQRINLMCQTNETSQLKQKDQQYISNEEVLIEHAQYLFTIEVNQTDFEIVSENLKKKMDKYRQRLLCSISHELRTPLNCIISMLDILNMKNDISEVNKNYFVNPALFSSYILLNTINDILDMAEVNRSGKIKMLFQEFSPVNLCHECFNFIKLQAQQKNLQLIFECEEQVPKLVYTDLNKARQVLLNLLSNALKFTQKGSIKIKLSYSQEGILQIDVSDTGCGIAPEQLKKIFFNFNQPEFDIYSNQSHQNASNQKEYANSQLSLQLNHNNNNSKNAGLGLNISYLLAKCLGDNRTLKVSSELGKGSTFTFYIISQSQNQKGCTFLPVPQLDSYNSQRSKYQYDSEYSENNQVQKSFFARNQNQMIQEEKEITFSNDLTTKSISQSNLRGQENNLFIDTLKNTNRSFEKSKQNTKNGLCLSFNNLKITPDQEKNRLDSLQSDGYPDNMKELYPESESEDLNSRSKTKSIQTSLLQINFNKTAFQIIQHASNICNQIYSQRDFLDDQHNLNLPVRGSLVNIHSPYSNSSKDFFQAPKQVHSKRNSISDDEIHNKILSSNNNLLKNKCSDLNIFLQKDMKDSDCSIKQRLNANNQHSISLSSLTQNKNCQFQNKIPQQLNQEKRSLENFEENTHSNKQMQKINSELYVQTIKNNYLNNFFNSPKQIESCDVLTEVSEKKYPNQSEKQNVCEKPRKAQRKRINEKITYQSSRSSENFQNSQKKTSQYQKSASNISKDINSNKPQSHNNFIMLDSHPQMHQDNPQEGIKHPNLIQNDFQFLISNQNKQRKCQCSQILIVDDNEFNIYVLQIRLKMYSFIVDKATSGFEAIDLIKKRKENSCCNKYSLIFMDIDMPVMNGYQTTEKILQFYKKLKTEPPVISACSAYIQENDKQKAYQVGMKYYITKPINTQSFENVLAQVFQLES